MISYPVHAVPSVKSHQAHYLNRELLFEAGSVATLTWTPSDVLGVVEQDVYSYRINVALYGLVAQENVVSWMEIALVATNMTNRGRANVTIPKLPTFHNHSSYLMIAFQVRFSSPIFFTNHSYDLLSIPAGIWTREAFYSYEGKPSRERCIAWVSHLQAREMEQRQINDLPPCPCNLDQARAPQSGFEEYHEGFVDSPEAVCYYQSTPIKT